MNVILFPFFCLLLLLAEEQDKLVDDFKAWCSWKERSYSLWNSFSFFISDKAFRNLFYYRVGRWSFPLRILMPGYDHLQITTPRGKIGGGLVIQHGFATIISAEKIGKNCKIYQQVTIGYNHKLQAPILGDNVEVCCGAKIIGGCEIGDNVLIGTNSVVTKDIPDNVIVAGVPCRIIKELTVGEIFDRVKPKE